MSALQQILMDPKYHDLLSILKGARNGFVYGVKIRFPHALVMTFLFSRRPLPQKIKAIFRATLTHAKNLAKFVSIYKSLLLLQRWLNRKDGQKGQERALDTFVAGLVGGWWVFGERNAINEQIVLYVSSRVLASFLPRLISRSGHSSASSSSHASTSSSTSQSWFSSLLSGTPLQPLPTPLPALTTKAANPHPVAPADVPFQMFAALAWGLVMYIYRHRGERLQPGMVNSMVYLYRDSEKWNSLKTLLWHNK